MLKAETKKKIADLLKIKETELDNAIKDEKEVDLAISEDLTVLSKEELESRDAAQKNEGKKEGREIGIKEVKKAAGLPEESPSKDPAKVAQAIIDKATTDAKVKPDEKVTQLTEQVNLLKTQVAEKDAEITKAKEIASTVALDRKILAAFPKERASIMNDDEYLTLIKSGHTFKEVDGKLVVEKDGKPLRNATTTEPLTLEEAIKHVFTERKGWLGDTGAAGGGRGGSDGKPPAKFTRLSEVKKHFTDQGKSLLGTDFKAAVDAAVKENAEFDVNN